MSDNRIYLLEPEFLQALQANRAKRKTRTCIGALLFICLIFFTADYLGSML